MAMFMHIGTRPAHRRVGRKVGRLGGLLVAAAVAVTVAAPAQATAPGRKGRIASPRYSKDGNRERIETVRPNGNGLRKLTGSQDQVFDRNPDWAPNGSRIVFNRETD